ncbi:clathrin interactor EPSIN [Acrasis kona]|uniref:Clathrin interactor EPSIN n=1 Tax=Acrasis kona TaxID=1008807 RepID=A0AAW2ZHE3_9EUKA
MLNSTYMYLKYLRNLTLYTPFEVQVRDLTSNDDFDGDEEEAIKELVFSTNNYNNYILTMRVLSERMADTGRNYKHVLKALYILRHLLIHSHTDYIVTECRSNIVGLTLLVKFQYVDENQVDRGEEVRRLSEDIIKLLMDKQNLRELRRLAAQGQFKGFPPLTHPSAYSEKHSDWESTIEPIVFTTTRTKGGGTSNLFVLDDQSQPITNKSPKAEFTDAPKTTSNNSPVTTEVKEMKKLDTFQKVTERTQKSPQDQQSPSLMLFEDD